MLKNFKPFLVFAFILLPFCQLFSQEKKDTIYFDEDWSICEKPVAEYYRICELNRTKEIFYKGDVADYFIDGSIEMTGHYSDNGYKNGEFIFYNQKGTIIKRGTYVDDEMKGDWFYYDTSGNLRAIFNCNSSTDFTPILVINSTNDTLLKNGNGKFTFDTQKDLPGIFPAAEVYTVKGEVVDNLKNGVFSYNGTAFSETYKNEKFIKGKSYNETIRMPLKLLHLTNDNLEKLDRFYHSNAVFGFGINGDQKVINFLLNNEMPEIESSSTSFYDNDIILFDIIGKVLRHDLYSAANTNVSYNFPSENPTTMYYSFNSSLANPLRKIDGDFAITVDTNGEVISSAFNRTLTNNEINKINYYLGHLTGLTPYQSNDQKVLMNIRLKFQTIIDTLENNQQSAMYMVFNPDSADNIFAGKGILSENTSVQINAKFPGGWDAWGKYLERNLNAQTPADHGAPNGTYTVTVSFLVDEDGNVSDIRAENDPGYGTAEEAVRVIKKGPRWTPAMKNGKPVIYRQKQNIVFQVGGQ